MGFVISGGTENRRVPVRLLLHSNTISADDPDRYMALLLEGGVYTDTDTAPVIPISEWGQPYTTGTDPLLSHLSTVLSSSGTSTDKPEDEPALVLSVESDAIDFGWDDWRSVGLVRAVQIVQWTMAVSLLSLSQGIYMVLTSYDVE